MNPWRDPNYRKEVAVLLREILNRQLTVTKALNEWPTKTNEDLSVECSYKMLWKFESGRDIPHPLMLTQPQIMEIQQAYNHFIKGEHLPEEMIEKYRHVPVNPDDIKVPLMQQLAGLVFKKKPPTS